MKITLLMASLIWFVQLAGAQNFIHEFGKYSNEEFQLKEYAKDPSAEAVVIYDIGQSHFEMTDNGFVLMFERTRKIKIFTKAGLRWAQMAILYYGHDGNFEEIIGLKGNTYNLEDGTIRKTAFDPNKSYNQKYNESWYEKRFAMPDVKEGSVIEISYKIKSPYFFNLRNWEFQSRIPVIYSEYTTKMVPYYEFNYILQGAKRFDQFKSYEDKGLGINIGAQSYRSTEYKDMVYNFVMKDIPAFKDESFITSINDYIIKLDFQLAFYHNPDGTNEAVMNTWPKMAEKMLTEESFGQYLKNSRKKAKDIIDTMHIDSKSAGEKARIIERFIKLNFNWNGYNSLFAYKSVKDFLTRKTGSAAEINLFLVGMLNAAGIEANPVILSTRSNGRIKLDYPFTHFFDYVIASAKIDGATFLLDATEPFCPFNVIPTRCLNNKGFVVQKNKVEWVDLKSRFPSATESNFDLRLNPAGDSIYQNCKYIFTGYDAIAFRNRFSSSYKGLKAELLSSDSLSRDSIKSYNLFQIDKPFEVSFELKNSIDKVEDKIIISPFCKSTITENPLKMPSRSYPVDMTYKKARKFKSTIKIPDGYKLLVKPENLDFESNLIKITLVAEVQNDTTINVNGFYEFKNDIYYGSNYDDLKGYFNKIVDKFNEKLVLVKI